MPVGKSNRTTFSAFSTLVVFVTLCIVGLALLPYLNIRLNPSRSLPSIRVSYKWHNASPRVIEQRITSPLEGVLSSINNLKNINSVSKKGHGYIDLEFRKNIAIDMARFETAMLIRRVAPKLPKQASYPSLRVKSGGSGNSTLMVYTLSAPSSPILIQNYVEDNMIPNLSSIKGIESIEVYGASPLEYQIIVNQKLIEELNIEFSKVSSAITSYFSEERLGTITQATSNDQKHCIDLVLKPLKYDGDSWRKIPVKNSLGRIIYLTDIAKIVLKEQEVHSYHRINGLNTINMVLRSEKGANELRVSNAINQKIVPLKTQLPPGFALQKLYDSSEFIKKELAKTSFRSVLSLLFLILFVLLVSRNWRYAFVIITSLLANLAIALIFYHLLQLEIHLYSLAGITVSFGIIIDNSIIMVDHYRRKRNRKVFVAILAATLTTIASLSIIFFLTEDQKVNLIDFSLVMIVNLAASLFIAMYMIPALTERIKLSDNREQYGRRRKSRVIRFTEKYMAIILFLKRFRIAFFTLFILGFGIPVHLLPDEIKGDSCWSRLYNISLGNTAFTTAVKPILEKTLGGSLRLFTENVYESSFYSSPERTRLHVYGTMPEGCTIQQLNEAIVKMEHYIAQYNEVESFETQVQSYKNGSITITLQPEFEHTDFPYRLKNALISKAIHIGGVDHWAIYGVGKGFSNALYSGYKSNQIQLSGYNYEELYTYAEKLKASAQQNKRIRDVEIAGRITWERREASEIALQLSSEKLALSSISKQQVFNELRKYTFTNYLPPIFDGSMLIPICIVSDQAKAFNSWWLKNMPLIINNGSCKLNDLGEIERIPVVSDIYKKNQQYTLTVAWDFVGPALLAERVLKVEEEKIAAVLPLGYKSEINHFGKWNKENDKQYYLILIVIAIVFIVCSILMESLRQPLAIIALIPVSFIGVFLTFYLFDFNFDQGGFASFIFLAGITVNSALYIINNYNQLINTGSKKSRLKLYLKAYNNKIMPVLLTTLSTVFGIIPFLISGQKEAFWFSFAVGTIGGLIFSLIAIVFFFPLLLSFKTEPSTNLFHSE